MNTSVGVAKENRRLWYESMVEEGSYDKLMGNMKVFIPNMMFGMFVRRFSPEEKQIMKKAYTAPFPTPESHIGAKAFPLDIPKGDSHVSSKVMQEIRDNLNFLEEKPKILIWGMQDRIFPPKILQLWQEIYSGTEAHEIQNAGHFLQEDAPEEIIAIIKKFLQENP
jgi:pimeloyl-ACP methyl ester carboxylesterase